MRKSIALTLTAAVPIAAFLLLAHSARAQLNVMQVVATLFFLLVFLRPNSPPLPETFGVGRADSSLHGLFFAWIAAIVTWSAMLPFYFVSEDFDILYMARQPLLSSLYHLFTHGLLGAFIRPVAFASLFIEYRVWHLWPPGFHLMNLAVHLGTVAGLYYLCICLKLGSRVATSAAMIFAVLPIHAEPVAWMGARFDLFSACFSVWAAAFYFRYRSGKGVGTYLAALLCFALAVLSKENAYFLAPLLFLAEWLLMTQRRYRPAIGISILAAVLFIHRWLALGGIGGYATPAGQPVAFNIGFRTLEGLLIRGPSQMLLGFNWVQTPTRAVALVAALAGAVLLLAAFFSKLGRWDRKLALFCFAWMVIAISPVHPMLLINASLMNSRYLHLGCLGLAVMIAVVIGRLPNRVQWGATVSLACLLGLGSLHNLGAWRFTSQHSKGVLTELKELVPSPEPGTQFVFHDLPEDLRGVYFLRSGFTYAVRIVYGRDDLSASRTADSLIPGMPVVDVQWNGETAPLLHIIHR